jgi:hypothetical protein
MIITSVTIQEHNLVVNDNVFVPYAAGNHHYQLVLDWIGEGNAPVGDISTALQTAIDTRLFTKQVQDYTEAKARIAKYQLSVGAPESTEEIVIRQELNTDTGVIDNITETITVPAIDPLEATVEQTTIDADGEVTTTNVANPLIVADDAERTAAQLIVDNTPQPVKDQVDGE